MNNSVDVVDVHANGLVFQIGMISLSNEDFHGKMNVFSLDLTVWNLLESIFDRIILIRRSYSLIIHTQWDREIVSFSESLALLKEEGDENDLLSCQSQSV
jgi:hypothetical protein